MAGATNRSGVPPSGCPGFPAAPPPIPTSCNPAPSRPLRKTHPVARVDSSGVAPPDHPALCPPFPARPRAWFPPRFSPPGSLQRGFARRMGRPVVARNKSGPAGLSWRLASLSILAEPSLVGAGPEAARGVGAVGVSKGGWRRFVSAEATNFQPIWTPLHPIHASQTRSTTSCRPALKVLLRRPWSPLVPLTAHCHGIFAHEQRDVARVGLPTQGQTISSSRSKKTSFCPPVLSSLRAT